MSEQALLIVMLIVYKVCSLGVGLCIIWFGFRLFMEGKLSMAGDLDIKAGERELQLKKAAPGTFFVLFGSAVIVATISKGVDIQMKDSTSHGVETELTHVHPEDSSGSEMVVSGGTAE